MDSQVWEHAFNKQKTLLWLGNAKLSKGFLTALLEKANPLLCVWGPPLDKRTWAYSTRRTQKTLCWCGGGGEQHRYPQQPIFSEVNYSNVPAPPPRSRQHSLSALITTIAGSISPHMCKCKHCSSDFKRYSRNYLQITNEKAGFYIFTYIGLHWTFYHSKSLLSVYCMLFLDTIQINSWGTHSWSPQFQG